MDDQRTILNDPGMLVGILSRLANRTDLNDRWETCVAIAREMGADALNVARFQIGNPTPVWIRISTHERGGLEEYVANDYMSVDPILTSYADGTMEEVAHYSLHSLLAAGGLSEKAEACYHHLLKHEQSDYVTFLLKDGLDEMEEALIVFACTPEVATRFMLNIDHLAVIANLFAVYTKPPTPNMPEGKVPLLYEFLSTREKDVLTCLAKGMHNDAIAHALNISEVTVRMHTNSARKKMRATTRAQAIALALVRNLITV